MQEDAAELAQLMVTGCQILSEQGLVEGFGHLSARLPDGHILMTPRKALGLVQPDELVTLDLEGGVIRGTRPALEVAMHLAVYRARPEVRAIARTHSRACAVLGVLGWPVRAVHGFGCHLGPLVPVYPEVGLIHDRAAGEAVVAALGQHEALLLRGNGTLVTAPSLVDAVVRAIWLEEAAAIQLAARAAGGEPQYFTPEEVARRLGQDRADEPRRAWAFYAALAAGELL
ncbi:MAG: class II aldolase/adducin family protein [Chloroflexi bacterium]|nr:class II aldolase/adducin family protein [Chloroflexota bacterium]